jgi:hypothetical protein
MRWVSERFFPILKDRLGDKQKDELATIDWVLDKARAAVLRWGWGHTVGAGLAAGLVCQLLAGTMCHLVPGT